MASFAGKWSRASACANTNRKSFTFDPSSASSTTTAGAAAASFSSPSVTPSAPFSSVTDGGSQNSASVLSRSSYSNSPVTDTVSAGDSNKSFMMVEKKGDLFKESGRSDSLAHCVSVDLRMGKGIATAFKNMFKGIGELQSQKVGVGGVAVLRRDDRFIYYLITKEKYYHKPTYDSVRSSLDAMKRHCLANGVQHLAMPRIACGLDGLKWNKVQNDIRQVFQDTNIAVTIYSLD